MKKVTLLRGCSGSGKSTLAKKLQKEAIEQNLTCEIFSADNYFMQDGNYNWQGKYIKYAHTWCFGLFVKALIEGVDLVIVDNTFIEDWTTFQYADAANQFGYELDVTEPKNKWARDPKELAKRNIHNVPESTINKMLEGLEKLPTKDLKKLLKDKFDKD